MMAQHKKAVRAGETHPRAEDGRIADTAATAAASPRAKTAAGQSAAKSKAPGKSPRGSKSVKSR